MQLDKTNRDLDAWTHKSKLNVANWMKHWKHCTLYYRSNSAIVFHLLTTTKANTKSEQ